MLQKPNVFLHEPNHNVLQNTQHAIFSGAADCMSFNLGFNELMCRDYKMCKLDWIFTLPITGKLTFAKDDSCYGYSP